MHTSQTQNLWLWLKRPPLAFSVAETSVAEMSGPKCPRPKCPSTDQAALVRAARSGFACLQKSKKASL